ncbi:CD225/dispanin family protein [Nocardiopsis aegyptia]|uniref:Heme/copper-type cytochrome/quinol oxidase subunit 2 n=1 Tax=Nocardiopsis aegyptia TaxID=220378 RepID=A0A7Z0EJI8_9ACTN|nr:CD225/dispanin family protein [Nocardiopsis aegyptia]NYJ33248.1 heme/copper-type cytochrome/quinol oxidase subunit 2 [Nocardiopsis aegyptia]
MSYGHQGPAGGYGTGGYGPPPPGGYGQGPGYGQMPPAGGPPKNYLVWNILGILSCIPLLGIIGLVFSLQINSKWEMGDYAGAEGAAKTAKILGIIGLILFIIGAVVAAIYVILFIVAMVLAASAPPTYY